MQFGVYRGSVLAATFQVGRDAAFCGGPGEQLRALVEALAREPIRWTDGAARATVYESLDRWAARIAETGFSVYALTAAQPGAF